MWKEQNNDQQDEHDKEEATIKRGCGNQQHKPMIRNKQWSQQQQKGDKKKGGNHQYNRTIKRRCTSPTKNDDQRRQR
jgi:hypothetical protein